MACWISVIVLTSILRLLAQKVRDGETPSPGRRGRSQTLRKDFLNLSVFPNDHRQTPTAEFGALFFRGAAMRLRCDTRFR
jgi:hypothetical protein